MDDRPINLTVTLPPGAVILPSWLVICFVGAFVFAALGLLGVWAINRSLVGEIRVLQLNVDDVQNVLIRQGVATRADFAPNNKQVDAERQKRAKEK